MADPHYQQQMGNGARPVNAQNYSNFSDDEDDEHRVVETDPTRRFERYTQCLGRGAYKEVFKGFDTEEGVEIAWNQLRVDHLLKREAHRVMDEIQILQSLRNENIINLYHSWIARGHDGKEKVYFITELMTSGTLKNYIKKSKGPVKPKVLKSWCKQILSGLDYLHSREPPIIHRDLKCENVFINGNNGQAKIGDLGLAVVKSRDHVSSVLGTPEFMAPELYDESYDEKVDIYAFGMMVLEIVTKQYPYSELTNQAQIYKKVTSGIKPAGLATIADDDTRQFIDLCISYNPRDRPTAAQLLTHPFVASVGPGSQGGSGIDIMVLENRVGVVPVLEHRDSITTTSSMESPGATDTGAVASSSIESRSGQTALPPGIVEAVQVDAASHTYTIHKRGILPTSTAAHHSPSSATPHMASTSGTLCSVEVIERLSNGQVVVKMIYGHSSRPTQEIKFPFTFGEDTAGEVVEEMVKEGIISFEDRTLATERLAAAVKVAAGGSSTTSLEAGRSGDAYLGVAASPPSSPATFPRYKAPDTADLTRAVSLPRSRDPGHLNPSPHGSSIDLSALSAAFPMDVLVMAPTNGMHVEAVAPNPAAQPAVTARGSVIPGRTDSLRHVPVGITRADSAPQASPTTGGPLQSSPLTRMAGLERASTAMSHPIDPELQRKLLELQELNLRGFGTSATTLPRNPSSNGLLSIAQPGTFPRTASQQQPNTHSPGKTQPGAPSLSLGQMHHQHQQQQQQYQQQAHPPQQHQSATIHQQHLQRPPGGSPEGRPGLSPSSSTTTAFSEHRHESDPTASRPSTFATLPRSSPKRVPEAVALCTLNRPSPPRQTQSTQDVVRAVDIPTPISCSLPSSNGGGAFNLMD